MSEMLEVGQVAPAFELRSQEDNLISLASLCAQGPVVVFFYPKDETPGCTAEACSFRDNYDAFREVGAAVVGISSDSIDSHRRFVAKHQFPFLLLSDSDQAVRKRYGVTKTLGLFPGRVTFVIDAKGIVRHVFSSQFNATKHIPEALRIVRDLHQVAAN